VVVVVGTSVVVVVGTPVVLAATAAGGGWYSRITAAPIPAISRSNRINNVHPLERMVFGGGGKFCLKHVSLLLYSGA